MEQYGTCVTRSSIAQGDGDLPPRCISSICKIQSTLLLLHMFYKQPDFQFQSAVANLLIIREPQLLCTRGEFKYRPLLIIKIRQLIVLKFYFVEGDFFTTPLLLYISNSFFAKKNTHFFYKNTLIFSDPEIFLNSRPIFGDCPLTLLPNICLNLNCVS